MMIFLFLFQIIARDGGIQPLTGTLNVMINVTDMNDNAPMFTSPRYDYQVKETAPVGTVINRVHATDLDAGENSRVTYRFSTSSSARSRYDCFMNNMIIIYFNAIDISS